MSYYQDVDAPGFGDGWEAQPYCIVSHDNGCEGGRVRVILGFDMDHAAHVHLTLEQAAGLASALWEARRQAKAMLDEYPPPEIAGD